MLSAVSDHFLSIQHFITQNLLLINLSKKDASDAFSFFFGDIHESPILEDDDDEFDPVHSGVAKITTAPSEQSTDSSDTTPELISPTVSRCSEELSQEPPDTPTYDAPEKAVLQHEGPDSVPAE